MTNLKAFQISFILGLVFLAFALFILNFGHLHEDAYILLQYSKKLALGKGIVFDQISGPTEGATDFLWMVTLAFMHYLGLDLATAAAILNSAGLILILYVILKLSGKFDWRAISGLILILFSGGLTAALGGFSTLSYGGFIMLFGYSIIQKQYKIISVLSLLIPLFRPDGVLLVLGGLLSAFIGATKKQRRTLFFYLAPIVFIGIGYFFWRYNYFQSILPLPLLVKAKTDTLLPGLISNFAGLNYYLILLILLLLLLFKKSKKSVDGKKWLEYLAFGLGPCFLFIALSFAHQSQNVGGRFQFPIVLALIAIFIISSRELKISPKLFFILALICSSIGVSGVRYEVNNLINDVYINSFPQILKGMKFNVSRIAITEAGRFPFWYDSKEMIDLVGLNSIRVVKDGATKVLNESMPELIFVHHADRYDTSSFDKESSYLITHADAIKIKSEYLGNNPVKIAPESALVFATENNYSAVLVQYGQKDTNFRHVYFLSPRLDIALFISALEKSMSSKLTYFQSTKYTLM